MEKKFFDLLNLRKIGQNILDFFGLGKSRGEVIYKPEPFEPEVLDDIDSFIRSEIDVPVGTVEKHAVRAHIIGNMIKHLKEANKPRINWDSLPSSLKEAA